jgi:Skp family chaperone for outer membrane proteins
MRIFGLLFALVILVASAPVFASTSVAVVDVVRILSTSDAALSIETQREAMRSSFLADISEAEQVLRREEQSLAELIKSTNQEEYAKKRRVYEENLMSTRKKSQEKKRVLEEASNKAMDYLRDQLYVVVQEIATERGYDLVISSKDVIAGEKSLDITGETLKRLNERIKKIPLKVEEKK